MTQRNKWLNAVIGAVITIGLSFTAVSPVVGGGVAGYLQGEPPNRGAKIGAISGVIAIIPVLLFAIMGAILVAMLAPASAGPLGGFEALVIFAIMLPILVLWVVGLSTLGGYIGGYLYTDSQPTSDRTTGTRDDGGERLET